MKFRHLSILFFFSLQSCSPLYVMRAGVEQAKILWRREPIQALVTNDDTPEQERSKLRLVLEARDFAAQQGLTPRKSFLKYSRVDRDVLLWVLSGSEKTSFSPVTWWFPIVGRVPYKGFFERDDGLQALELLKAKDLDAVLRPSPAFSTLGWFDDPLLSTTLRAPETALVNTVIHEILHSTIWIQNSVAFNESLANTVGHLGAIQFFRQHYPNSSWVREAEADWEDEKTFAKFITDTFQKLDALYSDGKAQHLERAAILAKRQAIIDQSLASWDALRTSLKTKGMQKLQLQLNNAVIIGYRLYLERLPEFEEFFQRYKSTTGDYDLESAIRELRQRAPALSKSAAEADPFMLLNGALNP